MKHIAITVDKNYFIHAAVMLFSLLSNNDASGMYVHVIISFKNPFFKLPIQYVLRSKKCAYKFYYINEKNIEFADQLVITNHISIATYFRLFLPSILKGIDKVLFLDCDMIVDGNIDDLYATEIDQHTLAAVIDNNEERIAALNLPDGYFNAGVLLLNLDYMRQYQYELKFQDFIKTHSRKIVFWDQDVLNVVTKGSVVKLNKKWNGLSHLCDEKEPPVIIHYAGTHKPWGGHSSHLLQDKYFYYLYKNKVLSLLSFVLEWKNRLQSKIVRIKNG